MSSRSGKCRSGGRGDGSSARAKFFALALCLQTVCYSQRLRLLFSTTHRSPRRRTTDPSRHIGPPHDTHRALPESTARQASRQSNQRVGVEESGNRSEYEGKPLKHKPVAYMPPARRDCESHRARFVRRIEGTSGEGRKSQLTASPYQTTPPGRAHICSPFHFPLGQRRHQLLPRAAVLVSAFH